MKKLVVFTCLLTYSLWAAGQPEKEGGACSPEMTKSASAATESSSLATMGGESVRLVGQLPKVGEVAPDFILQNADFQKMSLTDFGKGKKILNVVMSLDTPVCDEQLHQLIGQLTQLSGYQLINISPDMPYTQQRWKQNAQLDSSVKIFSDNLNASFGRAYGLYADGVGLLNRAVIILDENNIVQYVQKSDEMFSHLDYQAILEAASLI